MGQHDFVRYCILCDEATVKETAAEVSYCSSCRAVEGGSYEQCGCPECRGEVHLPCKACDGEGGTKAYGFCLACMGTGGSALCRCPGCRLEQDVAAARGLTLITREIP